MVTFNLGRPEVCGLKYKMPPTFQILPGANLDEVDKIFLGRGLHYGYLACKNGQQSQSRGMTCYCF